MTFIDFVIIVGRTKTRYELVSRADLTDGRWWANFSSSSGESGRSFRCISTGELRYERAVGGVASR